MAEGEVVRHIGSAVDLGVVDGLEALFRLEDCIFTSTRRRRSESGPLRKSENKNKDEGGREGERDVPQAKRALSGLAGSLSCATTLGTIAPRRATRTKRNREALLKDCMFARYCTRVELIVMERTMVEVIHNDTALLLTLYAQLIQGDESSNKRTTGR